ncbi:hypothetical protein VPH35_047263 [Triticum aestivum]
MTGPTIKLPEDLLVEVISRVPYKSTCCCKCVSTRWRDLISYPDHRKIFPRSTLAASSTQPSPRTTIQIFLMVTKASLETGALMTPPSPRKSTDPETLDYVVCNPATEKWVTVPAIEWSWLERSACLGFDPAVSSHFYVFQLVPALAWNPDKRDDYSIEAVGIYSTKVGVWTHPIVLDDLFEKLYLSGGAYLSGVLYLCSDNSSVAVVDLEGTCRIIPIPTSHDAPGGPNVYAAFELSFWVLEDSSSENCWTLKLNISYLRLFGIDYSSSGQFYGVISAHPEHNVIFIIKEFISRCRSLKKLYSYEMDSGELHFICDLPWNSRLPYLSDVPLFSKSLADGH